MINNIPKDWEVKMLGEVCESISAGGDKPNNITAIKTQENKIPIYANGISNDGLLGYTDTATIKKPAVTISARGTIGFVCVRYEPYFPVVRLISAIPNENILNLEFLRYTLEFFIPKGEGSSIPQLTIPTFKQIKIPLPPLEIQKAIVEKLENAFAHIDEAVRHLKAVQTDIPRLKSSLLHCAFSGKLTESQNQSNEVQTLKSVVGVEGEFEREEGATSPFKPLHPLIKEGIPQGWEVKTLGEIGKIKGGKRIPKGSKYSNAPTQYPYIRVTDFENMNVNTKNLKYLTKETQQMIKNYTISKDDVYISIAGSIGKVGIIPDELDKANLTENAAKIIHSMNKKYLAFYLNSEEVQSQISFFTKATTQPKLALYRIENLVIKFPPLETQKQIVQILESKFAHLEKLAQFVNASLENLQRLKSSLLNQAFKGELV